MAAVNLTNSPITQVSQTPVQSNLQPQLLTRLLLDLRGRRFTVERENILSLPESVLLCLFPNGLVLSRQSAALSDGGGDDDYEELYGVDFDPDCFDYVLTFFQHARDEFYGTTTNPGGLLAVQQQLLEGGSPTSDFGPSPSQNPLLTKQAIIVLREELEYFSIPPKNGAEVTDARGIANDALLDLKRNSGRYLLHKRNIFTALQRNVNKENNLAEQHLIDMLCMSGFDRDDEWGYRAMEPSRCCISSIALVLLKTGIVHTTNPSGERQVTIDYNQMATAQKLLLFWRKPARKCWWDGIEVDVAESEEPSRVIKLWARRVWTLELSLVSCYSCSAS
ncbi:phosphatase activator [Daedaleopsis nitida]|nr:phosphatase activator [Daedaleopsis nitida]